MKRTDPMSIRQIIDMVVDRSGTKSEMLEHRASYLWPDIVGPGVRSEEHTSELQSQR